MVKTTTTKFEFTSQHLLQSVACLRAKIEDLQIFIKPKLLSFSSFFCFFSHNVLSCSKKVQFFIFHLGNTFNTLLYILNIQLFEITVCFR